MRHVIDEKCKSTREQPNYVSLATYLLAQSHRATTVVQYLYACWLRLEGCFEPIPCIIAPSFHLLSRSLHHSHPSH